MITITYANFMASLALFTATCVAVGWLIKIIKAVKKPSEDNKDKFKAVDEKLDKDDKRIKNIEKDIKDIKQTQTETLKALLVILDELKRDNDVSGNIGKAETDINDYLLRQIGE